MTKTVSSQYVFGYQKFILYPEDYKSKTAATKKQVKLPGTVHFGGGRADIGCAKVHVHPRSPRQPHCGISPI